MSTLPHNPYTFDAAAAAGFDAGALVEQGRMEPEDAGDLWVTWADRSHSEGLAWDRGYRSGLLAAEAAKSSLIAAVLAGSDK